eukprot:CAMPEP_0179216570 /NCGR_PEP_ID=MMETSP0797-20121207/3449_1 /TAXON_ID=47934 /ORGANISM="Dinophysis acuminata, Strain DAEP01" /LENGTH=560 /DNA_ID=CAMNT_0020922737 /DNA_START=1 /DNA_END=1680 /DNA_ORIENTATION=+
MMRATVLVSLAGLASAGDACGFQCSTDADCGGCGTKGVCSSPAADTKYPMIAATCVDSPPGAPDSPAASAADATWPQRWTADVRAWCYPDFGPKATVARGRFYFDAPGGHSRADWHPYINGKDAKQVWIGAAGSAKSRYYVLSGWMCIYFPITDPGVGGSVSVEYPDWMARCEAAGMAKYVGREQVDGEWVDHYACVIDYAQVNQTIVFQNWHSLGLGRTPKGLPVRVTGGNSAPNGQKGSPRLNSVWYTNFTVGAEAVKGSDFEKPSPLCIPVGESEAASFLGVERLSPALFRDPQVQRRAHYMAHMRPSESDLKRARQKKPRAEVSGSSFKEAMVNMNKQLRAEKGLRTRSCDSFSLDALHEVQHELFAARSPALQAIYEKDRRSLPYESHKHLRGHHEEQLARARVRPDLLQKMRDGLCNELVMMYMHHLSAPARAEVRSGALVLPLLPERDLHPAPEAGDPHAEAAHRDYAAKTSCAICHITKVPAAPPAEGQAEAAGSSSDSRAARGPAVEGRPRNSPGACSPTLPTATCALGLLRGMHRLSKPSQILYVSTTCG